MQRFIAVIISLTIFSSCSNKSQSDLTVFKATAEGLQKSNELIGVSSILIYHILDNKISDPHTAEQAKIWQPKAIRVKEISLDMSNYIEKLIKQLKEEGSAKTEDGKTEIKEDDIDAAARFFENKGRGIELYEKLKKYKQDMFSIDPYLYEVFRNKSIVFTQEFESDSSQQNKFTSTYFEHTPLIAAIAMLEKFENNVKIMEHQFVEFCVNRTSSLDGDVFYEPISSIVSLSSSCVKAGEKIQITAGIGVFSSAARPVITIDNKTIEANEEGIVTYSFNTSGKKGKNIIPVKIVFFGPDGLNRLFTKDIEYTVVE
jgi:hypothetical protein